MPIPDFTSAFGGTADIARYRVSVENSPTRACMQPVDFDSARCDNSGRRPGSISRERHENQQTVFRHQPPRIGVRAAVHWRDDFANNDRRHAADTEAQRRVILADNVGYGDLGPYGGGELRGAPTPNIDQLAREGLRLTQYLVEPSCTPSRAALMTGQYSIRNGLSLATVPGSRPTRFRARPTRWGSCSRRATRRRSSANGTSDRGRRACRVRTVSMSSMASRRTPRGTPRRTYRRSMLSHSFGQRSSREGPDREGAVDRMKQRGGMTAADASSPSRSEVRAEVDNELTDRSIVVHPSSSRPRASRSSSTCRSRWDMCQSPVQAVRWQVAHGKYGDKMMEGDYHVGQVLDALKELEVEDNTLVVFASDNGPYGRLFQELERPWARPTWAARAPSVARSARRPKARSGPSLFIRWPGQVKPNTSSYAMFSIMDFLPTFAAHPRQQAADRQADRRRGPDGRADWQERDGTPRDTAHLQRRGLGGGAMEAMAPVLHRHPSDGHRAAARARHFLGQRPDRRLSHGLQHRNGPA